MLDPSKHPKGVGFVKYSTEEEAAECIARLNNLEFGEGDAKATLIVKHPKSKEEHNKDRQAQNDQRGGAGGGAAGYGAYGAGYGGAYGAGYGGGYGGNMQMGGKGGPQEMQLLQMYQMMQGGMPAMGGMPGFKGGKGGKGGPMGGNRGGGGGPQAGNENTLFVRGFTEASEEEAQNLFGQYGAMKVCGSRVWGGAASTHTHTHSTTS